MITRSACLAILLTALVASTPRLLAQEPQPQQADLGSFLLFEGFYTRALGNLSPTFPSASGGYVGYGHYLPDHLILMAKLGYSHYALGDSAVSGEKLSAFHILGGPRYYFATDGLMPFVFFNVGVNIVTEAIATADFNSNRTSAQFGWQVGFGLSHPIAGPVGLEVQAKYNSHFLHHEGSTPGLPDLGNMTGFEYGFGLTWTLQ
jgi:hypothetical protein